MTYSQFKQSLKHNNMNKTRINREIFWKEHERVQAHYKQWEKFYLENENIIFDIDVKRQGIAKKYFQSEGDELKVSAQGSYVPIKGAKLSDFDLEMEALMLGSEEFTGDLPESLREAMKVQPLKLVR